MRWRPGRNMLVAAYALIGAGVLGFFFPFMWAPAAFVGTIALLLALYDANRLLRLERTLSVVRRLPGTVGRGRRFEVQLNISYQAGGGTQCWIRDIVPPAAVPPLMQNTLRLGSTGTSQVCYRLEIPDRGNHIFGAVFLRLAGPTGFLEYQFSRPCTSAIRVLPETFAPDDALHRSSLDEQRLLDEAVQTRRRGEGTEFESLSEYREGDDPRRIDWRASARVKNLIVRRFQMEQHREVMILVDSGRLMAADAGDGSKLDRAIDAGLLLAKVALRKGDRCGFGVYDDQVRAYLPPVSGRGAMGVILDLVYDQRTRWRDSNFLQLFSTLQTRQQKRALLVLLSDVVDRETNQKMLTALAALAKRHSLLFVALRSPLLWQAVHEPADTLEDAARTAVALRLLQERDGMLHAIRRSGVEVLDLEPRQITVPLINHYLALRERSVA